MALEGDRLISRRLDSFVPNTHFLDAVNLYWFDRRLRLTLMDALERKFFSKLMMSGWREK